MKKNILWVLIIILLLIIGWMAYNRGSNKTTSSKDNFQSDSTELKEQTNEPEAAMKLIGRLDVSDNFSKGNLMLKINDGSTMYISTSRNYEMLIGEQVTVFINGNLESFSLIDIIKK